MEDGCQGRLSIRKKETNGGTTNYYFVGDAVLFTTTQNAFMLTENILDPDGTIVASKRFPDEDPGTPDSFAGEYYFYNYDIRGSVTSIIAPCDIEMPDGSTLQGGGPVAGSTTTYMIDIISTVGNLRLLVGCQKWA